MKSGRILLAVPALLCSTALVHAADMPQAVYVDDAHPIFSLTGTVGAVVMDLPDGGGLFEGAGADDPNDLLLGGTVGFNATAATGPLLGGLQGFIGVNGFATYAYGNFNKTSAFTGPGVVVMQGGAGPNLGYISIGTSSDNDEAHAQLTATNTSPQFNNIAVGGPADTIAPGAQDVPFTSGNGQSFIWGGLQTRVDGAGGSSTVYAAIADTNGGVFIAAGNLDGLTLTQNYTTQAFYAGGDVTFGVSGQNGTTTLQGYVGPSYRYLAQRNDMNANLVAEVPEYENLADFPTFTMTSSEDLAAHYIGGVAGLQATIPVSNTTAITLGVEGGAYYTTATLDSEGSYSVFGGDLDTAAGPPDAYPLQVVTSDGQKYQAETIAFAARGTAAYTMAIAQQAQLTFSGTVDYLSAVAQPAVNTSISGYDGDDDGSVVYQSGGTNDRISWGQMVNFSGSVSLTGQF